MVCQFDGFLLRTVRKNSQIRPPAYSEPPGYSDTTMRHLRPTSARRMGRKAGAGCILSETLIGREPNGTPYLLRRRRRRTQLPQILRDLEANARRCVVVASKKKGGEGRVRPNQ